MEYIVKIKSEIDNLIVIDNFVKKIIKKNAFLTLKLQIENNENYIINVEPIENSNNLYLPYKIFVENSNNVLKFSSNNIEVLSFENTYIINLKNLLATKDIQMLFSTNNYSIFNTYVTNIATKSQTINLPKLFNLSNTKKIGSNTILCFTTANKSNLNFTNESVNNEKYVVILNSEEVIFKDYYEKLNSEGQIEILSMVNDIARHAILTKIDNKNILQKIVYQKNKPKLTNTPQIIPLAFLQALKINNIKLCKYYLSENLKEVANLEILKSYFGDYKKIEFDNNRYILFYGDLTYKILEYEITNNKISKINLK